MASKKTPEMAVLQEFSDIITEAIVEPLSLSSRLYSRDIIDRRVQMSVLEHGSSYDKAMNLLKAIEAKIQAASTDSERSSIFNAVLDIMSDQIPLDSVAQRMSTRYEEIKLMPVQESSADDLSDLTTKTAPRLKDVLNYLNEASDKWYQIGIQLQVPSFKLKSIQKDCQTDADRLMQMVDHWFDNAPKEERTWEEVISALISPSVERRSVAYKVKQKFISS